MTEVEVLLAQAFIKMLRWFGDDQPADVFTKLIALVPSAEYGVRCGDITDAYDSREEAEYSASNCDDDVLVCRTAAVSAGEWRTVV